MHDQQSDPWRMHLNLLPEHMRESVIWWLEQGMPAPRMMGSFLRAALSNDFMLAFACADRANAACIQDWLVFLQHAPIGSCGSEANMLAWHQARHAAPTPEEPTP